MISNEPIRGRGAAGNPPNRFERLAVTPDTDDLAEDERVSPQTQFFVDATKSILAKNDSPDVPFTFGINPYRGCEHGCAYCYARPYHEYLGFSAGLDFENKIMVKADAPALLRKALSSPKYQPDVIAMSGVTDCYQPAERRLRITRGCLEVLAEFRNPCMIITKNQLVTRDADILSKMAAWNGVAVTISVTTLDADLAGKLEPRASRPQARLSAIRALADAGVRVGVNAAPMIPGLTDTDLPAIIEAAAKAGAQFAGYTIVRLPGAVSQVFDKWLEEHAPMARQKVLNRIREAHNGEVKDSRFGVRMHGEGQYAEQLTALYEMACRKAGFATERAPLSIESFSRPSVGQLSLFD